MKHLRILLVAIAAITATVTSDLQAQFRFGIKAGLDVSTLHFNDNLFDSSNRAGFTGGLMCEFTVPVIGVGFDLSAMYVRRNSQFMVDNEIEKNNRDYIEIPLNLKYKLSIPAIGNIITPFITTGPSVAFLTSRRAVSEAYHNKACDFAWNFGFGVQLLNKLQVAASYGLGLTKALEEIDIAPNATAINGKNRYWTVTAAYLF